MTRIGREWPTFGTSAPRAPAGFRHGISRRGTIVMSTSSPLARAKASPRPPSGPRSGPASRGRQCHQPRLSGVRIPLPGDGGRTGHHVWFGEFARQAGASPGRWNIPVFAVAIVLDRRRSMHRLAGLGHEASHYSLVRNKWANDLLGDVFCLFPILATIHFYRLFHLAHHQYTNDPETGPRPRRTSGPASRSRRSRWVARQFILKRMLAPLTSPASFVLLSARIHATSMSSARGTTST